MSNIHLLIVEDEEKQVELYKDAVEEFNSGDNKIIAEYESNANDCIERLKSNRFDAAIVDLNLEKDGADGASGNEVLNEIKKSHRFPILVVTGTPNNLDPSIEQNVFLSLYERSSADTGELLKDIEKIYLTGITKILGRKGRLEDLIQEIFWNHISDGFEYWLGKEVEGVLLRYSISHLSEYLDQTDSYLEPECYITPPIKEEISTGDIVLDGESRYVVMNPACDLQLNSIKGELKRKSNDVTLVRILDIDETILKNEGYIGEDKKLADKLSSFVENKNGQFSFLPTYSTIEKGLIDFTKISTVTIDEYKKYNRIATIAMPFLKDIQSRFSHYYGRQGQPDLEKDRIIGELKKQI